MDTLQGIEILPATRFMKLKRNRAIKIGKRYYLHPKVYKRISRRGASLEYILKRIKVSCEIPDYNVSLKPRYVHELKEGYRMREELKVNWYKFAGFPF